MVIMGATIGSVCHSLTCQRHGHEGFQDLAGVLGKRRQLLSNWWYEELVDVFELASVILKQSHFGFVAEQVSSVLAMFSPHVTSAIPWPWPLMPAKHSLYCRVFQSVVNLSMRAWSSFISVVMR